MILSISLNKSVSLYTKIVFIPISLADFIFSLLSSKNSNSSGFMLYL